FFRHKSGFGRKVFVLSSLSAGVAAGAVGYAIYDPLFRTTIEKYIPSSANLFKNVQDKKDNAFKSVLFVFNITISKMINVTVKQIYWFLDYEMSLKAALVSAESRVKVASTAKVATIAAITEHARLLQEAASHEAIWDKVSEAVERVNAVSREDLAEENEARNYLDNLRRVINDGKLDKVTRYTPLIVNAIETVNKLDEQLDELKLAVRKSRDESRKVGQFRDLIEQSRRIYADELKDLLPGFDNTSKGGTLSEDELNMLIAHAHLKVTQLRQRLSEQQAREEKNIAKAVEQQRLADAEIAKDELSLELKRLKNQSDAEFEKKLLAKRQEWEEETQERLRDAAAKYEEHLEQVVKFQRQLSDIEQTAKIDEAVGAERKWNCEQIAEAQKKLEGIQVALSSRLAADLEHCRSKQFWIACQNLIDSVIHGKKGGLTPDERRNPLSSELEVIKESSAGDKYVESIASAFSDEILSEGVYPEQDLKTRFAYVYKVARRVAKIDDNGGGILRYLGSYIQNLITFDLPRNYSSQDKIDPDTLDTYEILSRTKYFVDHGDLTSAIRIAQLLKGESARIARDWIHDTRAHLEARFLVELLLAHAAVLNVRTTYPVNVQ
uniref:MICOS complex subunit MIC60 n=1 Tax=Syphacia muris TaxID=451379 RepID=A0A0N5AXM9_9BILA